MCEHHDLGAARPLVDFSTMARRDILRGATAGALALTAGACTTTNPETGRDQFIIIDDAQLQQAALQAWGQQLQRERTWNNQAAQTRPFEVVREFRMLRVARPRSHVAVLVEDAAE